MGTKMSVKYGRTHRRRYKKLEIWDNRKPINKQKPIIVRSPRTLWKLIYRLVDKQGEVSLSISTVERKKRTKERS